MVWLVVMSSFIMDKWTYINNDVPTIFVDGENKPITTDFDDADDVALWPEVDLSFEEIMKRMMCGAIVGVFNDVAR